MVGAKARKAGSSIWAFARRFINKQFVRFLLVGALNTLFGYCLFALLVFIGLHYAIAGFIGTVIGIVFNFKTYGMLVFNQHDNSLILRFFIVYGIVYVFGVSGIAVFSHYGVDNYRAAAVLALPGAYLAYWLNRKFVFKKKIETV